MAQTLDEIEYKPPTCPACSTTGTEHTYDGGCWAIKEPELYTKQQIIQLIRSELPEGMRLTPLEMYDDQEDIRRTGWNQALTEVNNILDEMESGQCVDNSIY